MKKLLLFITDSVPICFIPAIAGVQKYDLYYRFWIPHQVQNNEKKPKNLKKFLRCLIINSIILFSYFITFGDFSYAQHMGQDGMECQPVYGHYLKSQRWGWYGAKRMVRTPVEAKEILEKVFLQQRNIKQRNIKQRNIKIGKIREHPRFFEADIMNRKGILIDLIIIDKRSGRIRSVY